MFADIILPDKNEVEFADLAYKLGYKKLYCLYDFNEFPNVKKRLDAFLIGESVAGKQDVVFR